MRYSSVCVLASFLLASMTFHPLPITVRPVPASEVAAAERNPDANGNYHVGDGVSLPKILYAPEPVITDEARRRHIRGTVEILAIIAADGTPKDIHVTRSIGQRLSLQDKELTSSLNGNAIKAVRQSRYEPAQFKGKPVAVQIRIKVSYKSD